MYDILRHLIYIHIAYVHIARTQINKATHPHTYVHAGCDVEVEGAVTRGRAGGIPEHTTERERKRNDMKARGRDDDVTRTCLALLASTSREGSGALRLRAGRI